MKLIIDIPEYIYEHAKEKSEDSNDEWFVMRAIAEAEQIAIKHFGVMECPNCGALFYEVPTIETTLEEIKAEFIKRYSHNYCGEPELGGVSCVFSLNEVLETIDKHISELKEIK